MKTGLYVPNFGSFGEAAAVAALAREAENAGWNGLFLWDHVAGWEQPVVDPWVALSAAAMATTRLRLGTTVTPLPRRRPWKLARETVSLDRLSAGRLTLSVGIGLGAAEWDALGEEPDARTRGAMLDEGLEVLTGLWSGEPFSYEGAHYSVAGTTFRPVPYQSPRIPVWVGGFWPNKAPFRRMARWDGMFPLFGEAESLAQELEQLREAVAYVKERRAGTSPFDVVCSGVTPGDKPDEAREIVGRYAAMGTTWWLEAIAPYRLGLGFDEPWPMDALRERVLQGPPSLT
jgi:probable F420-dependent oxidoreductase